MSKENPGVIFDASNNWNGYNHQGKLAILLSIKEIVMLYDNTKTVEENGIIVEREEIKPHYEQIMEILKGNPLDIVEVYCPIDICKKRNCLREDRYESQSEEQLELMLRNIKYSMTVDTSISTSAECADIIVKELFI